MPTWIIKSRDRYFLWSTVVDAPVSGPLTREELEAHVRDESGREGVERLPERLARADAKGSSDLMGHDLAGVLATYRGGGGRTKRLSEDALWKRYAAARLPEETG